MQLNRLGEPGGAETHKQTGPALSCYTERESVYLDLDLDICMYVCMYIGGLCLLTMS